jgi:hypothetical protein
MYDGPPRTQSEAHELADALVEQGRLSTDPIEVQRLVERIEHADLDAFRDERLRYLHLVLLSQLGSLVQDTDVAAAQFERLMGPEFVELMRLDTAIFPACVAGHLVYLADELEPAKAWMARLYTEVFDRFPSLEVSRITAEALYNVGVLEAAFEPRLRIAQQIERELFIAFKDPKIAGHAAGAYVNAAVYCEDAAQLEAFAEHVVAVFLAAARGSEFEERTANHAARLFGQAINFAPDAAARLKLRERIEDDLYGAYPTPQIAVRVAWAYSVQAEHGDTGARGRAVIKQMGRLLGAHSDRELAAAAARVCLLALPLHDARLFQLVDDTRTLVLEHGDSPELRQLVAHLYLKAIPYLLDDPEQASAALAAAIELLRSAAQDPEIAKYPIFGGPLELERFPDSMRDELIRFLQEVLPQ